MRTLSGSSHLHCLPQLSWCEFPPLELRVGKFQPEVFTIFCLAAPYSEKNYAIANISGAGWERPLQNASGFWKSGAVTL